MATIHIETDTFYRYYIENDKVNCVALMFDKTENGTYLKYYSFGIYLATGQVVSHHDKSNEGLLKLFMQIMSYIELTDIKHIVMKPKDKYRSDKKERFINLTQDNFYLVDVSWNTYIHVGEFNVRGHFRWQRCDRDSQSVKLIFIKEFKKSRYHRSPKKEQANNRTNGKA